MKKQNLYIYHILSFCILILAAGIPIILHGSPQNDRRLAEATGIDKGDAFYTLAKEAIGQDPEKSLQYAGSGIRFLMAPEWQHRRSLRNVRQLLAKLHHIRGKALLKLSRLEQAMVSQRSALSFLEESDEERLTGLVYIELGKIFFAISDTDTALKYYREGERIFIVLQDDRELAEIHNRIGVLYFHLARYDKALERFLKAVEVFEALGNQKRMANLLNNIGAIHLKIRNNTEAAQYFSRSISIKRKLNDNPGIGRSFNNLASLYLEQRQYDTALAYYQRALEIKQKFGSKAEVASTLDNIGLVFRVREETNYQKAIDYHLEAYRCWKESGDQWGIIQTEINLGTAYSKLNRPREAEKFLLSGRNRAKQQRSDTHYLYALEALTDHFRFTGQFKEALNSKDQVIRLKDRIFNERQNKRIAELNTRYQIRKKEQEIEILTRQDKINALKISEQKSRLNFQLLVAILITIIAVINFLLYRNKKRSEGIIRKSREALQTSNDRLEAANTEITTINDELQSSMAELHQANLELTKANELKNDFLNIAAHDLKNPLQIVLGYSDMVKMKMQSHQLDTKGLEKINQSVQRMYALISDLLDTSAIESGEFQLNCRFIDMRILLTDIIDINRKAAADKGQLLKMKIQQEGGVLGDESKLKQVFDNLVGNSIKFSPRNETIHVMQDIVDNRIEVSIRDSGPGLSESDQKDLFKKFRRLSSKPTGGESSTGLGLSISKQLIELHGGSIAVQSQLGEGTTFIVLIPQASDHSAQLPLEPETV